MGADEARRNCRQLELMPAVSAADLARRYWYLIAADPLWLVGLWCDVDPRQMTQGDALRAAAARVKCAKDEASVKREGMAQHGARFGRLCQTS